MSTDPYHVRGHFGGSPWSVWKRTATGDRRIAMGMSERMAYKVARLLNADEQETA